MRKASHVLGMVGGCLALVSAGFRILGGVLMAVGGPVVFREFAGYFSRLTFDNIPSGFMQSMAAGIGGIVFVFLGVVSVASGVLGLAGAAAVAKNNVRAGVLMLVGAGLCMMTGGGPVLLLLLLGGIFALVKEKKPGDQAPQ